jgi:N-acetylmuramoyl-L-alanine amidase
MKSLVQRPKLPKHIVLSLAMLVVLATAAFTPLEPTMIVVIDAGHGGMDPGNLGTGRHSVTEKDITLDVANKLANYITENMPEVKVVLTRADDSFPKLETRVKIANNAEADLFISIHCDAFRTSSARGCGTYVMGMHKTEESLRVAMQENASIFKEEDYATTYEGFDPQDPDTYIALALRQNLYLDKSLEFGSLVQTQFRDRVGRKDRGVRQAGYYVISYTSMPSVLVELGFLTNPEEEDFLISEEGKTYMASALYRALREYISGTEPIETQDTQDTQPEEAIAPTIEFKVQIASSPIELEKTDPIFQGEQGVGLYISNGQYKYTIGNFKTVEEAHKKKRALRANGFNGAFVAAFKEGNRIPKSEVPK